MTEKHGKTYKRDKHDKRDNNEAQGSQEENLTLEGRNAVLEAIRSGRSIDKVLVTAGDKKLSAIVAKAREAGLVVVEVNRDKLDSLSETGRHQGIVALCPAHQYVEVDRMLATAKERGEAPFIVILDGVADPYNLGAVIRSAEAAGAHGVVIPKRRAAGVTASAAKAAAGALEYLPVARVTNIGNTIDELKKAGLWVVCGAMDGKTLYEADLTGPIALVMGGEGDGLGRLVREKCDFSVGIPMRGKGTSLNVSVAAAVIMFEIAARRVKP